MSYDIFDLHMDHAIARGLDPFAPAKKPAPEAPEEKQIERPPRDKMVKTGKLRTK